MAKEGRYDIQARSENEVCKRCDATDIPNPIRIVETRTFIQALPEVVPVEDIGSSALSMQRDFQRVRNRRFPGTR
jgi:hypothetical protein